MLWEPEDDGGTAWPVWWLRVSLWWVAMSLGLLAVLL